MRLALNPRARRLLRRVPRTTVYTALELLHGSGVKCPPLSTYLDKLIDYAREYYRRRKERDEREMEDPLDRLPPN